jgi:hypothetical protein
VTNELELAAGASAGAFLRPTAAKHAAPPGTPCANCATPLLGPWCHECGQSGEDFHRSIVRLGAEVVEGLVHADGRLWRTLPGLMMRPGRLTRAYLEGHRAPQIPPLRLFLVVLLLVFVVGGLTSNVKLVNVNTGRPVSPAAKNSIVIAPGQGFDSMTPAQQAKVKQMIGKVEVHLGGDKPDVAATNWLQERLTRTLSDPERFSLILEQWSERFAFLMLPVATLLMSVLFIAQRRFFLFDHTIFCLHSLSAVGLLITLSMALSAVIDDWGGLLLLAAPVHLFVHMRGVYRTSIAGTLARMFLLSIVSLVAVVLLALGLVAVGLNGM